MRILHVTTDYPPEVRGGLGTAVGGLVRASTRAGIECCVLVIPGFWPVYGGSAWPPRGPEAQHWRRPDFDYDYEGLGTSADDLRSALVIHESTLALTAESSAKLLDVVAPFVGEWRPDLIHLHAFTLWPLTEQLRQRIPVVYTVHSLVRAEFQAGTEREFGYLDVAGAIDAQERAIRAADLVIALSESERELLARHAPDAIGRVRVAGNGIDDAPLQTRQRRTRRRSFQVLYVGRPLIRKGVRQLLEAIFRLVEHSDSIRFQLVGPRFGFDLDSVHGYLVRRFGLDPGLEPAAQLARRVHESGWSPPDVVEQSYLTSDLQVVPSLYEPFGLVVLEGMLRGLPIVASDVGGPAEILEHGRTGWLVPAGDVDALVDAILELRRRPALRRALGEAAAEEVRRSWLWPDVVQRVHRIYEEVVPVRIVQR